MFIDFARIRIEAGNGGKGCISFRREKFAPKGGPDGGDGGNGGDIVAVGDENVNTLINFKYTRLFKAQNGVQGQSNNKTGACGENKYIRFPLGTVIYAMVSEEADSINPPMSPLAKGGDEDIRDGGVKKAKICEVTEHNQEIVIAKGGNGGKGNLFFTTSTNQAPRYSTPGKPGEQFDLEIELKLMADVGLVGFPNAGKSTLLASISGAKPKIANYQFTTLEPMLGVVRVDEFRSFVMADIPGLIEGASDGKGLGLQFLRHIQRTNVLLFLLDITSEAPFEDYQILKKELLLYDEKLEKKRHLIVFSKLDLVPEEEQDEVFENVASAFMRSVGSQAQFESTESTNSLNASQLSCIAISSVANWNLNELKERLFKIINE